MTKKDGYFNIEKAQSWFGIKNVDLRIKMCFGEEYGVSVDSVEDEGTTITLRLPRTTEEKQE